MDLRSDMASLCRICMKATREGKSDNLYTLSSDPEQPNLYGMLSVICAPVFASLDDSCDTKEPSGLPSIVCLICKSGVISAYELHQRCIETDQKLREMVTVKQEVQDPDDDDDDDREPLPLIEMIEMDDKEGILAETMDVGGPEADSDDSEDNKPIAKRRRRKKKQISTIPIKSKRTCELCATVFRTIRETKSHLKEAHADKVFCCDSCEDVFLDEQKCEEHKITHTTDRPHGCTFCNEKFKSLTDLKYHTMNHTNDHPFRCSVCGKGFAKKHALQYHMLRHTGEKPFICGQCPSRFYSKGELKMHMVTHTKEKNHVCDICGNRFTKNTSLMKHARRVHAGLRPFPCSLCTLKFDNAHHLKRHMRTHTGEKPYKCAYCDRAYAQSNDLVKHSKIHVGENPYSCDRCDAAFRLMTDLRNHYKVHFQPGDQSETSATKALVKKLQVKGGAAAAEPEVVEFTSMATLNRRFEQEMQRKESQQQEPANFGLNFSSRF